MTRRVPTQEMVSRINALQADKLRRCLTDEEVCELVRLNQRMDTRIARLVDQIDGCKDKLRRLNAELSAAT
ncbi:MAG TPA: hypothetical protein VF463_08560 [Sphingobium sp.]